MISTVALSAVLGTQAAFAEDGRGGRGRGSDDGVAAVQTRPAQDNDVNDDRGVDATPHADIDVEDAD
jgi:hypothetical protein